MTAVAFILTTEKSDTFDRRSDPGRFDVHHRRRWAIFSVVAVVVLGGLWFGLSRGSGPSVASTVADCTQALEDPTTPNPASIGQPGVVGLGSVASIATFDTTTGLAWCFDGEGVGSGGITSAQLRSALAAPVAVVDGGLGSNVLMLVHLGKRTTSVVVSTATSHSRVLASKGGFEVLYIPVTKWPPRHRASRNAVNLGRIIGFDKVGRVTSSMAFTWCLGSINNFPGTAC
jgi:hypothetical protein